MQSSIETVVGSFCPDGHHFRILSPAEVAKIEERIEGARMAAAGVFSDPFAVHISGRPYKPKRYEILPPRFARVPRDLFRTGRTVERIGASEDEDEGSALIPWAESDYLLYLASLGETASAAAPAKDDPFRVSLRPAPRRHDADDLGPFWVSVKN